jgi:molybdopterin synthase sulfur carrier subunit
MIRVVLPAHLRNLAGVADEAQVEVGEEVTIRAVLDALEARHPVLRGMIREAVSGKRRPLVRFFANGEDLSHESLDLSLPAAIANGAEPFCIVGAMAGG